MTVEANDRRKTYPGNGVAVSFIGPSADLASEISVFLVEDATGASTPVTTGDYTLTGLGRKRTTVTMNLAPPAGFTLLILRTLPYDQQFDATNENAYLPETLERSGLDRLSKQVQQVADIGERSLRLPDDYVGGIDTKIPLPTPLWAFRWNAAGTGLEAFDYAGGFAAPTGAASVGFQQFGTGAVARTMQAKERERVTVTDYGADATGVADVAVAFQKAHDALGANGGEIIVPPGDYLLTAVNPTINAPTRGMLITKPNVTIRAYGARFHMRGMTRAYLDGISDLSSSGRDVFTFFTFLRTVGGRFLGGKFDGEWDGTGTFVFTSPRAKAIGIIGGTNNRVFDASGVDLLGNVVNATPSDATIDGVYQPCSGITVTNCSANRCYENGFNYMGNTFDGAFCFNYATECGSTGFEAATERLSVVGNVLDGNRHGMSISGKKWQVVGNTITNNDEIGLILSSSASAPNQDGTVSGNTIQGNARFGVQCYPALKNILFGPNWIKDNGDTTTYNAQVQMVGTVGTGMITGIRFHGGEIIETRGQTDYAINMSYCDDITIDGVVERGHTTNSFVAQGGTTSRIRIKNAANETAYSISATSPGSYAQGAESDSPIIHVNGAAPTSGTHDRGTLAINKVPSAGGNPAWQCVTAGTFGTLAGVTAATTAASTTVTPNTLTGILRGQYITIAGVTGVKKITNIDYVAGTFTIDVVADATVAGAAVAFSAPVYAALPRLNMEATEVWDLPSLALGATSAAQTIVVTGATIGDAVDITFSLDAAGIQFWGYVSAASIVTYFATNLAGTNPLDLGSGTIKARVRK